MSRIGKGFWVAMALFWAHGAGAQLTDGLYAAFETSMGSFTCRLDYAEAPLTCANFAGLAEGSQNWLDPQSGGVRDDPYYDGLIFHRVMDGFMIQTGCPLGTGMSGPGYAFPDEFTTLTHHGAGILSMANSGIDSNGSQFFITLENTDWLDGKHSVFGEVVGGMDTVSNIGAVATDAGARPLTNVVMNSIEILRVGSAAEAFDPLTQPLPEVSSLALAITNGASGMAVVAATSNQCEQTVYVSTNLLEWASSAQHYSRLPEGDWTVPASANLNAEFFRGVRVFYPQAATNEIAGHTLELMLGSDVIVLQPELSGGGRCSYKGDPGIINSWQPDPAYCGYLFFTDILVPLSLDFNYSTATNGLYEGFYYSSSYPSGWRPMSGTFTDTLPAF